MSVSATDGHTGRFIFPEHARPVFYIFDNASGRHLLARNITARTRSGGTIGVSITVARALHLDLETAAAFARH